MPKFNLESNYENHSEEDNTKDDVSYIIERIYTYNYRVF